jgi:thiamine-monophosphate kinase
MTTAPEDPSLADLGEWSLIERLAAFAPAGQFLDDAALLTPTGTLVVNTDVLVDGVHFSDATTTPFDVGWRAAAANLSDLAAMGCCEAQGITVGLVAPGLTRWSWVEGVYSGLQACLRRHGGVLLGGDCSSGVQRVLAVTALGSLPSGRSGEALPIRRQDGRPGDLLVSSGAHGLSALGLALLQASAELDRSLLAGPLIERAIARHQRPCPRFDAVRQLQDSRPIETNWRVAGTDSSDGLLAATTAIARASGCRAVLDQRQLPLDPAMAHLPQAEHWCLNGGEDFELVLALEAGWASALVAELQGSSLIGRLEKADTATEEPLNWLHDERPIGAGTGGYQHFNEAPNKKNRPEGRQSLQRGFRTGS